MGSVGGKKTPLTDQVGGSHYRDMGIQPMEYSEKNGLSAAEHSVVKYITRHKAKGGVEDLRKAIQCVQMVAWFQYGVNLTEE